MASRETTTRVVRVDGVDVARGLASAIMIQGHAYDGWVAAEHKLTASYRFTRLLGTLPLPAFLVLAGAAIALRCEAAVAKGEAPVEVRTGLVQRGLFVMFAGYAVNAVSALLDGWEGPETFFRADVLQLIGFTIALYAQLALRGPVVDRGRLVAVATALTVIPLALCVPGTLWGRTLTGWLATPLAVLVEVPAVTRMPFVPLASWAGLGVLLGLGLASANRDARDVRGAPTAVLVGLFASCLVVAVLGSQLTEAWVLASGRPLGRTHPAVLANAIELAARGGLVLSVGALLTPHLPGPLRRALVRLGRGSLVAYVVHMPFCYGLPGRPIAGRLDMIEATFAVLALEVVSYGAVWARDRVRERNGLGRRSPAEATRRERAPESRVHPRSADGQATRERQP